MFWYWQFHNVFACEFVELSCFILQQENFTSDMKSSEVELWKSFYLTKTKCYHKVLRFGYNSSYLGTNGKYNRNKKVKAITIIHVCNEFDMKFWRFWWGYGVIFDNMYSECYWEFFIVFFCYGKFRICVWWEEKFRDVAMFWSEWFVWWPALVCW